MHRDAAFYTGAGIQEIAVSRALFIGASAGWRRDLFTKYGPLPETAAYEDLVLGFRAALEDRVAYAPERLIRYRVGVGVSFAPGEIGKDEYRGRRRSALRSWRDVLVARLVDAETYGMGTGDPLFMALVRELWTAEARLAYHDGPGAFLRKAGASPLPMARVLLSELNRVRKRRL